MYISLRLPLPRLFWTHAGQRSIVDLKSNPSSPVQRCRVPAELTALKGVRRGGEEGRGGEGRGGEGGVVWHSGTLETATRQHCKKVRGQTECAHAASDQASPHRCTRTRMLTCASEGAPLNASARTHTHTDRRTNTLTNTLFRRIKKKQGRNKDVSPKWSFSASLSRRLDQWSLSLSLSLSEPRSC